MKIRTRNKIIFSVTLSAIMLVISIIPCCGAEKDYKKVLSDTAESMASVLRKTSAVYGNEWFVMDTARAGVKISDTYTEEYFKAVESYVSEQISKVNVNGAPNALDKNKSTENSRLILTLASVGKYATSVAGYDLLAPYESFSWIKRQGIMGPVWALIALDTYGYETEDKTIRKQCIDYIIERQLADGGWDLSNKKADTDVTAMTLTALAPYRDQADVKAAAKKAFDCLSLIQNEDGGFNSWGTDNSESCVQVIVACTSWGIDPDTDSRFVKKGNSAVDNLLSFSVFDKTYGYGFAHVMTDSVSGSYSYTGGEYNAMATEQACYGLIAYDRFLNGKTALYDMSDVNPITDISADEYYAKDVFFAYNNKLMNGVGNREFDPNSGFSRAMVVTVLFNLEGKPSIKCNLPFSDVAKQKWFYSAVAWAYSNGIISGTSSSTFEPDSVITKQEFFSILARYSSFKLYMTNTAGKNTEIKIKNSKWANDSIDWALANSIITEADGPYVDATLDTSRSISAVYFHRFFVNVIKND